MISLNNCNMKYYQKCPHCNCAAFEYLEKPYIGMEMKASYILVNGKHPKPNTDILCQKCNKELSDCDLNMGNLLTIYNQ